MTDLSRPWPLGLGTKSWWVPALLAAILLLVTAAVDRPVALWAQGWPAPVHAVMGAITTLGLSDWLLIPSAVLFAVTLAVVPIARRRRLQTSLRYLATLYGYVFVGVALPGLASLVLKRVIGRGRPMHLTDTGLYGLRPNVFDWDYQSFPSGHATTIFAAATLTAFLWPRATYPVFALAALVALSRVVLGDHYPSDVVAGAILGVLGAYVTRWVYARRRWLFVMAGDGRIAVRPMAGLLKTLRVSRPGSAPGPRPNRP